MKTLVLFILIAALAQPVAPSAADDLEQETYLLPVYTRDVPVPGILGSLWRTELVIHNANDRFVEFGPCNRPLPQPCPPLLLGVNAGESAIDPRVGFVDAGVQGRLVYVRREDAAGVEMKLRLADVSRRALDAGTEIPVIRSASFATGTLRLHNVPAPSDDQRLMLRVFDVDDTGPASSVEIRVSTLDGVRLHTETRAFTQSGYPQPAGLPSAASYIEMPVPAFGTGPVRLEVVPLTPGLRFWAYVSVTNNVTQHVLLVTPP